MTSVTNPSNALNPFPFPDHTQLPESDGTFVFAERAGGKNWQEHPQSILLTDSITPILKQLNPVGFMSKSFVLPSTAFMKRVKPT